MVGCEGQKYIAKVYDASRTETKSLFVKIARNLELANEWFDNWQDLRNLGITVPSKAWVSEFSNGTSAFIATDLSEDGKKLVLSCNNPELEMEEVKEALKMISQATKLEIHAQLLRAAIQASGLGNMQTHKRFALAHNVFALVLDLNNPNQTQVVAIDFGVDMQEGNINESNLSLLSSSIFSLTCFCAIMLGEYFELPNDPILEFVDRKKLRDYAQSQLDFSWPQ